MFNYGGQTYGVSAYGYPAMQNQYTQRPQYQPQMYQQPQPMMQDGAVQARLVSGREEAVAATVIPGTVVLFYDRARGMIYSKLIDPQTGMPEFKEYADTAPVAQAEPAQYVTVEMFNQFQQDVERRMEALQPARKTSAKAVTSDD